MALNDSTIELTWQDSESEMGYRVERAIDDEQFQEIGSAPQDTTRFADTGLRTDHQYRYRLIAFSANGEEAYVEEVFRHGLYTPSDLVLTPIPDSGIRLEWQDNSTLERGFKIERKEEGGSYSEVGSVGANVTTYTDTDVTSGKYTYRVRAFTAANESPYSDERTSTLLLVVGLPGGATMEMVWIEPGTFMMGSPSTESGRDSDEGPQHEVRISMGFYLGKYEVTQQQWESVMGTRPWSGESYAKVNPSHAVSYVSWDDAQAFIRKLNQSSGRNKYRLPTEAEWEYGCRAGTTTRYSFGGSGSPLGQYAWYDRNAWDAGEKYAHEVGTKLPNPWGLHDMHGNVWEWCQDWYGNYSSGAQTDPKGPSSGAIRIFRGGSWCDNLRYLRCAERYSGSPGLRYYYIGFRLCKSP